MMEEYQLNKFKQFLEKHSKDWEGLRSEISLITNEKPYLIDINLHSQNRYTKSADYVELYVGDGKTKRVFLVDELLEDSDTEFNYSYIEEIEPSLLRADQMLMSPPTTNKPSKRPSMLLYLIPSKRREEVIGDLYEIRTDMMTHGFPEWKIRVVLFCHMIWIVVGLFRVKLEDYGKSKKQVEE